jgi:hypothetical protein
VEGDKRNDLERTNEFLHCNANYAQIWITIATVAAAYVTQREARD